MAIVTLTYRAFEQDTVLFEEDYDDATMRVVAVRCVNTSGQWAFARVTAGDLAPSGE